MKKSIIITALILALIFGTLFGFHTFMQHYITNIIENTKRPAPSVSTIKTHMANWQPYIESTGQLKAKQGVTLVSEAAGVVDSIEATSGQMLNKGDIILSLKHDVENAQLQGAKATLMNDTLNYQRQEKIYEENQLVSKTELEAARTKVEADKATVAQISATIDQKILRAPFAGRLGIINVNLGQYINAQTNVSNIQTLTPIRVNYTISETELSALHLKQPIALSTHAYPNKVFSGNITAIDSEINDATKSIAVQGTLDNTDPKHPLIPGMFVTVKTLLARGKDVVIVPQTAINYTLYGDSIFQVIPATKTTPKHVKLVYVTLGEKRGALVAVTKGLADGVLVVTAGQMKLTNGSPIR